MASFLNNIPPLVDIALAGGISIPSYYTIEYVMKLFGANPFGVDPNGNTSVIKKILLIFLSGCVGFAITPTVKSLLGLDTYVAPIPKSGPSPTSE